MATASRVQLLDLPVAEPGVCALCGAANKPVIDFGKQLDWYGAVYFCQDCIREIAEAIGYVPVGPFEELHNNLRSTKIELDQLKREHEVLKRAMADLLSGNTCSCGNVLKPIDSGVSPVEIPEPVVETNDDAVSRDSETEQPASVERTDDFFDTDDFE